MLIRALPAFLVFLAAAALPPAQSAGGVYVIRNVRVFDGEAVTERQTVVISDGKIAGIGNAVQVRPGAQEVPGEGRTLLPGLIDAHVHLPFFGSADALQQMAAFGVTSAVVMWAAPPLVAQIKKLEASNRTDVASVVMAGTGATAPGGHPTQMDGGRNIPTLTSPAEADAFVAARLAEGSEFIKIIHDDTSAAFDQTLPTLDQQTMAAVVTAAHARGTLAVAHIGSERFARAAVTAGVDGLAHLFVGASVSDDFGTFVAARRTFVIPTLSVLHSSCGIPDGPGILQNAELMKLVKPQYRTLLDMSLPAKASCQAAPLAVRQLVAAGAPVLAGSDAPAPGLTYGASLHWELEHLVNAGMTPTAALTAATSATASAFRWADRGRIRTGMRADLLLVNGDPSKDIQATRNIVAVWKSGARVQSAP
jgi:imidazolonepropionase-like amidohydrolase